MSGVSEPVVSARNLVVSRAGADVVREVDLGLPEGEIVVLACITGIPSARHASSRLAARRTSSPAGGSRPGELR